MRDNDSDVMVMINLNPDIYDIRTSQGDTFRCGWDIINIKNSEKSVLHCFRSVPLIHFDDEPCLTIESGGKGLGALGRYGRITGNDWGKRAPYSFNS